VDKLTLAALEATLRGPATPTARALVADVGALRKRAAALAGALAARGVDAVAVDSEAAVGGGGAPGVRLPSAAVSLPADYADRLRAVDPAVLGRIDRDRCLLDLRAVDPSDDPAIQRAVLAAGRPDPGTGAVPPAAGGSSVAPRAPAARAAAPAGRASAPAGRPAAPAGGAAAPGRPPASARGASAPAGGASAPAGGASAPAGGGAAQAAAARFGTAGGEG
jgi:hypothetical protein